LDKSALYFKGLGISLLFFLQFFAVLKMKVTLKNELYQKICGWKNN